MPFTNLLFNMFALFPASTSPLSYTLVDSRMTGLDYPVVYTKILRGLPPIGYSGGKYSSTSLTSRALRESFGPGWFQAENLGIHLPNKLSGVGCASGFVCCLTPKSHDRPSKYVTAKLFADPYAADLQKLTSFGAPSERYRNLTLLGSLFGEGLYSDMKE